MKLAVFGATGSSGLNVIERALNDGHSVVAVARSPEKLEQFASNDKFKAVKGDVYDADSLAEPLKGCDAVMSCLGYQGSKWATVTLYSESMKSIVSAMERNSIRKLVAMTSWCTVYQSDSPKIIEWFFKPLFIGRTLTDMARMESFLETKRGAVDYTCVRPAGLVDKPATDRPIKAVIDAQWLPASPGKSVEYSIPRNDVARFMLSVLDTKEYDGKCVAIGYD